MSALHRHAMTWRPYLPVPERLPLVKLQSQPLGHGFARHCMSQPESSRKRRVGFTIAQLLQAAASRLRRQNHHLKRLYQASIRRMLSVQSLERRAAEGIRPAEQDPEGFMISADCTRQEP